MFITLISINKLEVNETGEGLLLKPFNRVAEMKGIGKSVFGNPVKDQSFDSQLKT